MAANREGIFGSRPWKIYGEGPSTIEQLEMGRFGGARDVRSKPYTGEDIRFTTRKGALFAYLLALPREPRALIKSLATNSPQIGGRRVKNVSLLGSHGKLKWVQDDQGLHIEVPANPGLHAIGFRVEGVL